MEIIYLKSQIECYRYNDIYKLLVKVLTVDPPRPPFKRGEPGKSPLLRLDLHREVEGKSKGSRREVEGKSKGSRREVEGKSKGSRREVEGGI